MPMSHKIRRRRRKQRSRKSKKQRGGSTETTVLEKNIPRKDTSHGETVNSVPLVIYQTWWTNNIPKGMKSTIEENQKMNPEFEYHLFTDQDCEDFIRSAFDEKVLKAFQCLKPGAYKADLWRYCILYEKGGVYMDIKLLTKTKLLDLVKENSFLLVKDDEAFTGCYWNGFMISSPKHPILKTAIDEAVKNIELKEYGNTYLDTTGPCLLGKAVKQTQPDYKSTISLITDKSGPNNQIKRDSGELICEYYHTYREEQANTQNKEHYAKLWKEKDIFTC